MTPEEEAEAFIQAAVDQSPEPLRRLGEFLSRVLDDDHWKTADRMLLAVAVELRSAQRRCGEIDGQRHAAAVEVERLEAALLAARNSVKSEAK